MSRLITRLPFVRHTAGQQFIKFAMVGVLNTMVDFFVYLLFTRGWLGFELHFLVANLLGFLASVLNSYFFNKRWTFRNLDTRHHIQFTKFLLVNSVTLGLYELLLYLLIDRFGFFDLAAKLFAIVLVTTWNFTANKYWTFRTK